MDLIDLKLPKRSKEEMAKLNEPMKDEGDRYPYGMKITFESEQVEKFPGMEDYRVGEKVMINGLGEVINVRMNEKKEGKKEYSVEMQIKKISVNSDKKKGSLIDSIEKSKKGMLKID